MARRHRDGSRGTPATVALIASGIPFSVHPYDHDPAAPSFGLEAAAALGVDPASVFKTLLVDDGDVLAVGVLPVDRKLDVKAMAAALGVKKVQMAEVPTAERVTGYVAGGISPFGQRRKLRTVVDASALDWPTVYVSGGRRGLDLGISSADLVRVTGAVFARIVRG